MDSFKLKEGNCGYVRHNPTKTKGRVCVCDHAEQCNWVTCSKEGLAKLEADRMRAEGINLVLAMFGIVMFGR